MTFRELYNEERRLAGETDEQIAEGNKQGDSALTELVGEERVRQSIDGELSEEQVVTWRALLRTVIKNTDPICQTNTSN